MRKKIKYLILCLIVIVTLVTLGGIGRLLLRHNRVSDSLKAAYVAWESGDLKTALNELSVVMGSDPVNVEALSLMEEIAYSRKEFNSVADIRKRLMTLEPLDSGRVLSYCISANDIGRYKEVCDLLLKRQGEHKLSSEEIIELGISWLRSQKPDDISELAKQIEQFEESERKLRFMSDYALFRHEINSAVDGYTKLAEKSQNIALKCDALLCLGRMCTDIKAREDYMRRAVEIWPISGLAEYGKLLMESNRTKEMTELFTKYPDEITKSFECMALYGEGALMLGDQEMMKDAIGKCPHGTRRTAYLQNYLEGMRAFMVKDYKLALEKLFASGDCQSRLTCKYIEFVSLSWENSDDDRYLSLYTELIKARPGGEGRIRPLLEGSAIKNVRDGKYGRGLSMLRALGEKESLSGVLEEALLICLVKTNGDRLEQKSLSERILSHSPDNVPALETLARLETGAGNNVKALELLERLHRLRPESMTIFMNLVLLSERMGQEKKAEALCREGMKIEKISQAANMLLASILLKSSWGKEALDLADALDAGGKPGEKITSLNIRAMHAEHSGDYRKASGYYGAMIENGGKYPYLYEKLAQLSVLGGNPEKEEQYYREGLAAFPQAELFKMRLAVLLSSGGRDEEALSMYEELVTKYKDNWLLLINYSECAAVMGKRKAAFDAAAEAKRLKPMIRQVCECYIMRLFEESRYEEVLTEISNYRSRFEKLPERLIEAEKNAKEETEKANK